MVSPDDKAQRADRDDGPDHHSIAEDVFASVNTQDIRDYAERG